MVSPREMPPAIFKANKIMTMTQLKEILSCSERTVRRYLQKWQVYVSYNKNSAYYTLPQIPKFNQHGIWEFRKVYFSQHGNLGNTLRHIIEHSTSGLTANEISEILGLPAYTFLSHFKDKVAFTKEKYNGIYVYFSNDHKIYTIQKRERLNKLRLYSELHLPTDTDAIIILVELIKHPKDSIEQLIKHIKRKAITITINDVRNLFLYHGILKKTLEN